MAINCGNREHGKHSHATLAQVKLCFERTRREWNAFADQVNAEAEQAADAQAEYTALRYLEDRGFDEARFQEQMEAQMGVVHPDYGRDYDDYDTRAEDRYAEECYGGRYLN